MYITSEKQDQLLDTSAAAKYLAVSVPSLNRWRMIGIGPDFVRMGKSVRYPQSALDRFVRESIVKQGRR